MAIARGCFLVLCGALVALDTPRSHMVLHGTRGTPPSRAVRRACSCGARRRVPPPPPPPRHACRAAAAHSPPRAAGCHRGGHSKGNHVRAGGGNTAQSRKPCWGAGVGSRQAALGRMYQKTKTRPHCETLQAPVSTRKADRPFAGEPVVEDWSRRAQQSGSLSLLGRGVMMMMN
jgi:hypothetical protein